MYPYLLPLDRFVVESLGFKAYGCGLRVWRKVYGCELRADDPCLPTLKPKTLHPQPYTPLP